MVRFLMSLCLGFLACSFLTGCGDKETTHQITDVRQRGQSGAPAPHGLSDAERLGLRRGRPPASNGGPSFEWTTPEGWEEVAAGGMRKGSWKVAGQPETDCSLVMLQGGGGDALSNVNRWRGQMGLEGVDEAALAPLPRKNLLGQEALYLNLIGVYGGMGSQPKMENARLLGLILSLPRVALFLKFTGPAAVVEAETAHFEALAASIAFAARKQPTSAMPTPETGNSAGGLTWEIPQGWVRGPKRMMRVATFAPEGAQKTECYVTILAGNAGGVGPNVNRWRQQMGQKALSEAELAQLPHLEVLGKQATLVTIEGKFVGMGEANVEGAVMYALICERDDDVVFVKMTGPANEMKDQKAAFEAFGKSLR